VEIDPSVLDQVTAVSVEPVTVAVNCSVPPDETVATVGDMEIETFPGGSTVTVAEAETPLLAWLVALTVMLVLAVTVGAVKSPELETEPAVVDHVTAVLVEPVTVAVNCWVPAERTVAEVGETETETLGSAAAGA
jgi:hypothetical protein